MHNKGNYKQGEKTAFRMGENNSKRSNWQIISKLNRRFAKEDIQMANKYMKKNAQHHSLSEKCKSKPQ